MVKIFVGRLVDTVTKETLVELFSKYGEVIECDVMKNFAFVHMAVKEEAEKAIDELDKTELDGQAINVEFSFTKVANAAKLFVGNLAEGTQSHELHKLFKKYGTVLECDVIKNYAFVHMSKESQAREAIRELHNYELNGNQIRVQMARTKPAGGRDGGFGAHSSYGRGSRFAPYEAYDAPSRSRYPRGAMGPSPYERMMRRDLTVRRGGASYMRLLRAERAMLARRLREGYGDPYAGSSFAGGVLNRYGAGLDGGVYSDFADDFADLEGDFFDGGALDRYGSTSAYGDYY